MGFHGFFDLNTWVFVPSTAGRGAEDGAASLESAGITEECEPEEAQKGMGFMGIGCYDFYGFLWKNWDYPPNTEKVLGSIGIQYV